jgi:uncharacterized protein with FMN-binding domain
MSVIMSDMNPTGKVGRLRSPSVRTQAFGGESSPRHEGYTFQYVSERESNKKVANGLVALSAAAVLAVYSAGYLRTRSAADRFALQAEGRRPAAPPPTTAAPPVLENPKLPPVATAPVVTPSPAPAPSPATKRVVVKKQPRAMPVPVEKPAPSVQSAPAPVAEPPVPVVEPAPVVPAAPPPAPAAPKYKDGTYLGWGTSRHGDIQASVVIEDGRIASATIAQCLTRYSCSVIAKLPPQVAERQSPETDYVSGATQSTNAFYYAVVDALSKAK